MRFGLPADFDSAPLLVAPIVSAIHGPYEEELEGAEVHHDTINASYNTQFKSLYQSLEALRLHTQENKIQKLQEKGQVAQEHSIKNRDVMVGTIESVVKSFKLHSKKQSCEVRDIIEREKKRLVQLEEERLRLLEEARIQEEKEAAERKKEEEAEAKAQKEKEAKEKEALEKKIEQEKLLKKQKAELARQEALAMATKAEALKKAEQQKAQSKPEFVQQKALKDIQDIKTNVVEALKNEPSDVRKAVSAHKRKLNPKFGQLSSSFQQLDRISNEVIQLIQQTGDPSSLIHKWILNFVAKAIVSQAETEVTVKSSAALPLARLSLTLLCTFPEFEYYFKARIIKKCPFTIGYTCSIESEEGRKRMGWRRNDEKWESDVKYDERVAGICTFWTVITRLPQPFQTNKAIDEFFRIESSWRFAARLANLPIELLSNAHFVCLSNWWEAGALDIMSTYKGQGQKLLEVVSQQLVARVVSRRFPGAARLGILGEEFQQGKIENIKEMER